MSGRVGSITTDIIADGLVFNMDAANRASTIPSTSTTTVFNTVNPSITGSIITDGQVDTSTIVPSFAFDGSDGYIDTNDTFLPDFVSVFAWVKSTATSATSWTYSIVVRPDNPYERVPFDLVWNAGAMKAKVRIQSTSDAYNGALLQTDAISSIANGNWHYIGLTFNGPSLKFYLNGVQAKEKLTSSVTNGVNGPLYPQSNINTNIDTKTIKIGRNSAANRYFEGNIGPVQIYNRALSATEVMKNFNALKDRMGYIAPLVVSFLVVAGGGGGGADNGSGWGGGGGAGGYRNSYNNETSGGNSSSETPLELTSTTNYTVTVGGGGSGTSPNGSGEDSVFSTITSIAGGGGGQPSPRDGEDGGSGGGAAHSGNGGSGTSNQGLDGADGVSNVSGGGGGASQAGGNGYNGNGGDGLSSSITGTAITRAGGGGGTNFGGIGSGNAGAGGAGGGGTGGRTANIRDAVANTGGGGGGGIPTGQSGGTGGSGIVILRYPNSYTITVGAGLTSTTSTVGTDKVTIFTEGTGNVSFS